MTRFQAILGPLILWSISVFGQVGIRHLEVQVNESRKTMASVFYPTHTHDESHRFLDLAFFGNEQICKQYWIETKHGFDIFDPTIDWWGDEDSFSEQILKAYQSIRHPVAINAPFKAESFNGKTLIFSPGWGASRHSNIVQMIQLALKGFVIVTVDHPRTGIPATTVFPNGEIEHCSIQTNNCGKKEFSQIFNERTSDIEAVLGSLDAWNQNFFKQSIDMNRLGLFGQSNGGATAAYALSRLKPIKAAINLDGSLFSYTLDYLPTPKPYLFIGSLDPKYDLDESGDLKLSTDFTHEHFENRKFLNFPTYLHMDYTDMRHLEAYLDFPLVHSSEDPKLTSRAIVEQVARYFNNQL
jgi:predicted esterase